MRDEFIRNEIHNKTFFLYTLERSIFIITNACIMFTNLIKRLGILYENIKLFIIFTNKFL